MKVDFLKSKEKSHLKFDKKSIKEFEHYMDIYGVKSL